MKRLLLLASIGMGALGASACTNPEVPAGHEGYVFYTPLLFGQMEFRESLPGPATTGISWRLTTINIDMRASSFKEDFKLLTAENLSVEFEVNTRIRLRPGSVRDVVENWGAEHWYEWNVKERLRTVVREQVTEFSALDIQLETPKVRGHIEDTLRAVIEKNDDGTPTPIMVESVDIGEIHFPEEVASAIERKIATKQELQRQRFVLAKTKKEAAIKVLEAIRVAKQQLIISSTLDPLYVQQRAIQVYRKVAKGDNEVTIVLPNSSEGTALPLILEPKTRRVLTPADIKRIDAELAVLEEKFKGSITMDVQEGTSIEGSEPMEIGGSEDADPAPTTAPPADPAATATPTPAPAAPTPAAPAE